jgi:hypothetical protein
MNRARDAQRAGPLRGGPGPDGVTRSSVRGSDGQGAAAGLPGRNSRDGEEPDPFDTSTMLCAYCSVMPSALCERCRALVARGANRGPLPAMLIPQVPRALCWACRPPQPTTDLVMPNPALARFCAAHVEASIRRRSVVPLEYDKPQRARVVDTESFETRPHFFF